MPFGGLLAADLQAGEILLVHGATGSFGSAGVAVALAMGAACVVAAGRNRRALDDLVRRFGERVRPVVLSGDSRPTVRRCGRQRPAPMTACSTSCRRPRRSRPARGRDDGSRERTRDPDGWRRHGSRRRSSYPWLMRNDITVRGKWMYPRWAPARLVAMIRSGLIDLRHFEATTFALEQVDEAVAHASANAGPFRMTVIRP